MASPPDYRTCIVRAWVEQQGEHEDQTWRLTLEIPRLGLRRGFHSREELVQFLLFHLFADDSPDQEPPPIRPDLPPR